jgi:hypothetical protein
MSSSKFYIGSAVGAGVALAVIVGVAAAMGHPIPYLYKKQADQLVKPKGLYWSLSPSGATDASGVAPQISARQAKMIADVLKAPVFQQANAAGGVSFIMAKPVDPATEIIASPGLSFFQRVY